MSNPIETITGSVTTSGNGSLKVNAFHRSGPRAPEQPLFLAEKDSNSGVKIIGAPDVIQAGAKRTQNIWSKKRHSIENGGLIKFCFTVTKPGSAFGFSQRNVLIRVRDGAALHRIRIEFPTDQHSRLSVGYIEGRFDILKKDEIEKLGLGKNAAGSSELQSYYEEGEEEDDLLSVSILEKEMRPLDTVKAVVIKQGARPNDGGTKVLLKQRKVRNIRT